MTHIEDLKIEQHRLTERFESLNARAKELEQALELITESKSYRVWQKYGRTKRLVKAVVRNPKNLFRGLKFLFKKGPRELLRKIRSLEAGGNSPQTIAEQYENFFASHYPSASNLALQSTESHSFSYRPTISIILPTYNTPPEFLKACLDSVIAQSYDKWELCICDDASPNSTVRSVIKDYADKESRVKYIFSDKNGGIATATNTALSLATGEFIALLDHDDVFWPNALYEITLALNNNPSLDFIYTDEDQISEDGKVHHLPFFKPDWSPDLLFASMYTGHLTVYRKKLVNQLGNFDSRLNYSQDYDLALRMSEVTNKIHHIPRLLYSWRVHPVSAAGGGKPYARETNILALSNSMRRRGYEGEAVAKPTANKFNYVIDRSKLVSIIIPTDSYDNSVKSINSILQKTEYSNIEICLVINSETGDKVRKSINSEKLRIIPFDKPFNFSAKCNLGANEARGEFLVIINDDIAILEGDWIERQIEYFARPDVGAVSPKLIYEDHTIQYAGMVTGVRGLFGTAFHKHPEHYTDYFNLAQSTRNCSVICGACFAIRRNLFIKIKGFDEINTPINHSDIDLSFKIRHEGLLIVYTPFTTLMHYGHQSIGAVEKKSGTKTGQPDLYMLQRWGQETSYDPYYPPLMRNHIHGQGWTPFEIFPEAEKKDFKFTKSFAFISHETSLTGAPLLIFWLARLLKRVGYYIVFIVPKYGPLVEELKKADITVIIDGEILTGPRDETLRFLTNFDVVMCNTIVCALTVLALKGAGIQTLWYIHESEYGLKEARQSQIVRSAFEAADQNIFANEEIKEKYSKLVPKLKGQSILPGLDEEVAPIRKMLGEKGVQVIIHIGSIERRKGQDILVDAFSALPDSIRNKSKLLFAGRVIETGYFRQLEHQASRLKNVSFIGEIGHAEVTNLYQTADLFVCSSRDETGPLTVLEAMKYQIPLISSRVGIVPMVITDKKNGLLTETDDVSALTEALLFALTNPKKMKDIARQAHSDFTKTYTLPEYKNRFIEIVDRLD